MNGYNIYLMIELAKCHGIIPTEQEYDTTWKQGEELYYEFQGSRFDVDNEPEYECINEFLDDKEQELDGMSPEEEIKLNIEALQASFAGKVKLANTIWTLIELKGYRRLDYTMNLTQMEAHKLILEKENQ